MKKTGIIILIVTLSLLVYSLTKILILSIQYKDENIWFADEVERNETTLANEEFYDISKIENIKLDFKSSNVKFILTDEEQLRIVQYASNKEQNRTILESKSNGNTLEISERLKNRIYLFYWNNVFYDIYLPKTYYKNLELSAVSGDVEIDKLELQNLKFDLSSGDIKISESLNANEISITSISGDLEIGSISSEKLKIETTSADIEVEEIIGNADIKTVSGEIYLGKLSSSANMETISGDVKIDEFVIEKDSKINSTSGDIDVIFAQNSDCQINTKTTSGDINLPRNGRNILGTGNGAILNIETVSGNINTSVKED